MAVPLWFAIEIPGHDQAGYNPDSISVPFRIETSLFRWRQGTIHSATGETTIVEAASQIIMKMNCMDDLEAAHFFPRGHDLSDTV